MGAPAHTVLSVHQFLTEHIMILMSHPPYSPDLAPTDLFFVSLAEKSPQRKTDVKEVKQKTAEALQGIQSEEFKNGFEWWKNVSIGALHQTESTLAVTEV